MSADVVRLPVAPRPRPVEDPAAELPHAAVAGDERHEIGAAATLALLLLAMPWLLLIDVWLPRRRRRR